jgi:flagellin
VTSNNSAAATVSFTIGAALDADGLAGAITAFNDKSAQTGVTAKLNTAGTGITLTNETGEKVLIKNNSILANTVSFAGVAAAGAGVSTYMTGALTLDSDKTFGLVNTTAAAAVSFFTAASTSSQLQAANTLDVSTVSSATRTLATVDAAISAVNNQRAAYGALQSRFDTTVSNLQTTSENMSAARSRIQDADFAQETANLSRAQILQQAGTAMVAQANQLPQGILALLR